MVDTIKIVKTGRSELEQALNTNKNLYSYTWNKIFKEIKNNLVDPKQRGELFVFGQYPEWHISDRNDSDEELKKRYPLIIITNPVLTDFENQTLDYLTSENSINVNIEIYSDRNDYLDLLTDNILYILLNSVQTSARAGLHNMQILNDSYSMYQRSGLKIHSRVFNIRFDVVRG